VSDINKRFISHVKNTVNGHVQHHHNHLQFVQFWNILYVYICKILSTGILYSRYGLMWLKGYSGLKLFFHSHKQNKQLVMKKIYMKNMDHGGMKIDICCNWRLNLIIYYNKSHYYSCLKMFQVCLWWCKLN